jgi:hypothetical protein
MSQQTIDGVLIQWGDRLFYPGNRVVKEQADPWFARRRAAAIRGRIEATVLRHAPQVMVKVTGGGRGMKAIAAHFRYISKHGRLEFEDERGQTVRGQEAVRDLVDDWRYGGTLIPDMSNRREAFNIILSMPRGTDPAIVQRAAREFAQAELADHKYVMVLHNHQAHPHVHISVRVESKHGKRLNPRRADLHRWRETFAEKLRGWGVDAEATRQPTRGATRNYDPIWRVKAKEAGRLRTAREPAKRSRAAMSTRSDAIDAWTRIADALGRSQDAGDRGLAAGIRRFLAESPVIREAAAQRPEPARGAGTRGRAP